MKLKKSSGIFIVVIFAIVGFTVTYKAIRTHTIQYACQDPYVTMTVTDHSDTSGGTQRSFRLPVVSKLAIDSAASIEPDKDEKHVSAVLYHENPSFLVWTTLICIMMTLASASFPVFFYRIFELKARSGLSWTKVLLGILYTVALIIILILTNTGSNLNGYFSPPQVVDQFHILFDEGSILTRIVITTVVLLFPAITVVFLTALSSDRIPSIITSFPVLEKNVRLLCYLEKTLQNALYILAIVVAFSVLTSNMLGASIRATIEIKNYAIYPTQIGAIYGAYFSLFLGILYVPVYYYMKEHYEHLKEVSKRLEAGGIAGNFKDLFPTPAYTASAIDNLKLALTVLSPLLTSLLPNIALQ